MALAPDEDGAPKAGVDDVPNKLPDEAPKAGAEPASTSAHSHTTDPVQRGPLSPEHSIRNRKLTEIEAGHWCWCSSGVGDGLVIKPGVQGQIGVSMECQRS